MQVGDEVEVEEPKGSFLLPEDTSAEYVFVAGGIGITVFRSMLRYIADEQLPYRVTLVYSNRDRESAAFLDELEELEGRIEGLRVVLTMTDDDGWEGETPPDSTPTCSRELVGGLDGKQFLDRRPAARWPRRVADSLLGGRASRTDSVLRGQVLRLLSTPVQPIGTWKALKAAWRPG